NESSFKQILECAPQFRHPEVLDWIPFFSYIEYHNTTGEVLAQGNSSRIRKYVPEQYKYQIAECREYYKQIAQENMSYVMSFYKNISKKMMAVYLQKVGFDNLCVPSILQENEELSKKNLMVKPP